jgi:stringent starvation protein B
MKKASLAILVSLAALSGAAYAQDSGVTMSTDPAKAADVEQRAQDLQAKQESMQSMKDMPMEKHHKPMHHHKKAMKAKAEAAPAAGASQ